MEQHETINSVVDEERKNGDCGPEDAPKTAALTLNGCKSTDNSTGSMIKRAEDDAGVGSTITAAVSKTGAGIPGEGERESAEPGKSKRPFRPPGSIRKARKEKRKAGWDKKKAAIKEKKRAERERREEAMRQAGLDMPTQGKNYRELPKEQWSVSQKIRDAKRGEFETLVKEGGYRVCVDMAFENFMVEKAQASLVQQILYLYGANRKATQPCFVTLSGMGAVMTERIKKLQGFDMWLGTATDSRCYTEVFDKKELVYLTADSPNTIAQLEKGKVYILGGLVDRNAHKGMCFNKAQDHGIATAKLPLKKEDLRGTHSKVLATNHVFDILVKAMGSDGDLQKIEEKALPPRKRPGWTGGDDRGPSSKPIPKRTQCAGSEGGVEKGSSAEDKTAEDVACSTETTGKESRCACEDGKVCKDARVSCTKKSQRSNSFTKEMSAVVATSVDAVVESGEKAVETDVVKRTKRDESTVGSLEAKRAKTASGENVA